MVVPNQNRVVVSNHNCKHCHNSCNCISIQPTLCMMCNQCRATKRLVNEAVVRAIIKSPMSPDEIADAMNASVED